MRWLMVVWIVVGVRPGGCGVGVWSAGIVSGEGDEGGVFEGPAMMVVVVFAVGDRLSVRKQTDISL